MADQFIGYLVSIDCKNNYYQGIITSVDVGKNIIKIKDFYKNGSYGGDNCSIELKSDEIQNIEIIADSQKAQSILKKLSEQQKQDKQQPHQQPQQQKLPIQQDTVKTKYEQLTVNNNQNRYIKQQQQQYQPSKQSYRDDNHSGQYKQKQISPFNNYNYDEYESCFTSATVDALKDDFDFEKNLALFDKKAFYEELSGPTTMAPPNSQPSAPSKASTQLAPNYHPLSVETLFSMYSNTNGNNSNVNGNNSAASSANGGGSSGSGGVGGANGWSTGSKNYRFDEMIIDPGAPLSKCQIKLPIQSTKHYVTDDGFIVPCIDNDLKHGLIDESYKLGYTQQRQIECMGRCATEMIVQLLGGPIRFHPKNNHQKPKVLVLANNEIQGAYAICTARLLSIRNVVVYLYTINDSLTSKQTVASDCAKDELKLFSLCEAKKLKSLDELQNIAIDLIVNGLESSNNIKLLSNQLWYLSIVKYLETCKANVLSIDPPSEGCIIKSKWSIVPILPLAMSPHCGRIYLCDFGYTNKLFNNLNIKYQSPFGAKFLIPLHND